MTPNQYIIYRLQPSTTRPGKTDKIPLHPATLTPHDPHDPAAWMTRPAAEALAAMLGAPHGVGFVFTADAGYWFLDLDDCADNGQWRPEALALVGRFPGAYVEVSVSGKGLHVVGRYSGARPDHATRAPGLELYTGARFMALGTGGQGDPESDHTAALHQLIADVFPPRAAASLHHGDGPRPDWRGPTDDGDLLRRAMRSSSAGAAFGTSASFADLWAGGDVADRHYHGDHSSADAALAQHLAFWTGCDGLRIERLMRQSGLARDKYDRPDYLPRTVAAACGMQRDVCQDKPLDADVVLGEPLPVAQRGRTVSGETLVPVQHQLDQFAGYCYVADKHRVITPGGQAWKPDQFKTMLGGWCWVMDAAGERVSRDAWEVFTQSQAVRFPKADTSVFRPSAPPGEILHIDGQTAVNTWRVIPVRTVAGDPGRFLRHLAKLLPVQRDYDVMLAYLAAVVQHQGVKFQWCPILQGTQGNGKTLLSQALLYAVGTRHGRMVRPATLSSNFNSWMEGTTFVAVEDLYAPGREANELIERLKPIVTGTLQEVEGKGIDQRTVEVCFNMLINCNDKGSLPLADPERRWAVMYTAQQCKADLARDGMDGSYFPELYQWAKEDGYAIVTDYLRNYPIPDELNPAKSCQRAPTTSSTDEALDKGRAEADLMVLDAIAAQEVGFRGDWVSLYYLRAMLDRPRSPHVSRSRTRELLQRLGYDWHPHMPKGQAHSDIAPDNRRSVLFCRVGSHAWGLPVAAALSNYTAAQTGLG